MDDSRPHWERPVLANYDAESALLAAILNTNAVYFRVATFCRPADFADALLGRIFEAMGRLIERGQLADVLTLKDQFDRDPGLAGAGGDKYLARLANSVITIINAEDYGRTIRDLADRRRLRDICGDAIRDAEDVIIERPASQIAADLAADVTQSIARERELESVGLVAARVVDSLKVDLVCYPTGLSCIDRVIGGGLFPGKFYGLPARHKAGKTMLASTISWHMNRAQVPHLYFALEMGADEITQRMLAKDMGCNSLVFLDKTKRQSPDFIARAGSAAVGLQSKTGLNFQARPRMTKEDIRQTIARAALVDGIKGFIVDYLQLVTGQERGESTATHLDNVTQMVAEMCKRYGLWGIATAQTNQEGNIRGGEGLLNACDMTLCVHRIEGAAGPDRAWLEMMATRFTPKRDIGSASDPALEIDTRAGPMFVETLDMPMGISG